MAVITQLLLDKRKPSIIDGVEVCRMVLRITYQRQQRYITLRDRNGNTIKFTQDQYDELQKKRLTPNQKRKVLYLQKQEERAAKIIDNMPYFDFARFKDLFLNKSATGNKKDSLPYYFEKKIHELTDAEKFQTAELYKVTQISLESFYGRKLDFGNITPAFLKRYENSMIDAGKSYNTVGIYMRNLRALFNVAIENQVPVEYPFKQKPSQKDKYQIPVGERKPKALSLGEVKKLINHIPKIHQEREALMYWLFSYFSAGINFADIAELKFSNIENGYIKFVRKKTKDTTKSKNTIDVQLNEFSLRIIDTIGNINQVGNYIFPIYEKEDSPERKYRKLKQWVKNTNKYLKRIAKDIEINENITTYWARHTYASVLKEKAPIEFIRSTLGHTDLKTTQNYLDKFNEQQTKEINNHLMPE